MRVQVADDPGSQGKVTTTCRLQLQGQLEPLDLSETCPPPNVGARYAFTLHASRFGDSLFFFRVQGLLTSVSGKRVILTCLSRSLYEP